MCRTEQNHLVAHFNISPMNLQNYTFLNQWTPQPCEDWMSLHAAACCGWRSEHVHTKTYCQLHQHGFHTLYLVHRELAMGDNVNVSSFIESVLISWIPLDVLCFNHGATSMSSSRVWRATFTCYSPITSRSRCPGVRDVAPAYPPIGHTHQFIVSREGLLTEIKFQIGFNCFCVWYS